MPTETIELRGHIMDSHTLEKVLDQIMALGGDYEIESFALGHKRGDESYARVRIEAPDRAKLEAVLELVTRSGAMMARREDAKLERAPRDGIFPDDFYATTNLPTEIMLGGKWVNVANAEMDCAIIVDPKRKSARGLRMHRVKKGERVVTGHAGVRVELPARPRDQRAFEFMASAVSSEKPKLLIIREIVRLMKEMRASRKKILFVGGPAIIHTGAGQHLQNLIDHGYINVLFAGNALAAHDIESNLFGTSLGVSLKSGSPVEHGHEHHLRAINRIRAAGSIKAAVQKKVLTGGVMHACVKRNVKYVLSGSIRDDGPLPDVITDMPKAQDAMRAELPGVGLALMVGTTLLSIATGNMLPAAVRMICVDINPAVVTKLADRGSLQAIGLVTDAELFLRSLTREMAVRAPGS